MNAVIKRTTWCLIAVVLIVFAVPAFGQEVEVDRGVFVTLPERSLEARPQLSHLTGLDIAIDVTHDTGRQNLVTTSYTTIQGDLAAAGANLTFVNSGPLTLALLNQYDAWWLEEDWNGFYSAQEKTDLMAYVMGGGCLFLNGDEHQIFAGGAEWGAINALFGAPYAFVPGSSGTTFDITPDFLTDPLPVSAFPGPVTSVSIGSPTDYFVPVPPAYDVVRDLGGGPHTVANFIGAGGVVLFGDEISLDGPIAGADNRTLANRAFEFCALALVIEVDIDLKFCSNPNAFNCKQRGKTPVTIFGTSSFDVNDIDISSLQLCEDGNLGNCTGPPLDWSVFDRGDPTTDLGAAMCAIDPTTGEELHYLNQDGWDDLDVAFDSQEVVDVIGCAGLNKGDPSLTLVLTGMTFGGTPITSVAVGDVGIDQLLIKSN